MNDTSRKITEEGGIAERLGQLRGVIQSGRRLIIFLHHNPDPDAIAAGWFLAELAASVGVRYRILYSGNINRAENRAMVQLLKAPLHQLDSPKETLRFLKSDRYALVDTQPGVGNNAFPVGKKQCHIVIDHHPDQTSQPLSFKDIQPDLGCCVTMLLHYYRAAKLVPSSNLATAGAYAIISETQDLGREATRQDQEALQFLIPNVRWTVLGRIRHPSRTRDYYRTVARAMQRVMISRNTCICHIGKIDTPEMVAEVADLLVAMERITGCLVTGCYEKLIPISIRTTHKRGNAERIMKRMLGKQGTGGGHGMIAGGVMPCQSNEVYSLRSEQLSKRFTRLLRRKHSDPFKPLLDDEDIQSP